MLLEMTRVYKLVSQLFILSVATVTNYGEEYKTLLTGPRLHFSGNFICDPATVNNNIQNFDISNFIAHHALPSSEGGRGLNSPSGTNSFLLKDVAVKSICYANQTCTEDSKRDFVVGKEVKDNPRSMAKIVDIDSQDPVGVTQIWAMRIRIPGVLSADAGVLAMRGMWKREASDKKNIDSMLTGRFHGILKNIEFENDNSRDSVFAKQLKREMVTSNSKQLSIRFVLDMLRFNHTGRIYGTIGCHGNSAPQSMLYSRVLMSVDRGSFNKASFGVDERNMALIFDFGSSFRTTENGTHIWNESEYYLITYKRYHGSETQTNFESSNWSQNREILGVVPLWNENWLTQRSGFLMLNISENQLKEVANSPLEVIKVKGEGANAIYEGVILKEEEDGVQIFSIGDIAFRMESGDKLDIELVASKFGRPQPDVEVTLIHHCERDERDVFCEPKLPLPMTVKTDKNGQASATLKLPMLRTPRKVMDGQVYNIVYFSKAKSSTHRLTKEFHISQYASIVLKVFDHFEYESETTWVDHVYPIFLQYANLFPVMKGSTFDISNYYSVIKMRSLIIASMNLPMNHSSYMPVTRDLSRRKRRMIVDWLSEDKPKIGKVEKLMNLQHLRSLLQTALEVEHATIPPYLTALWSIRDKYNRQIYRLIKTVVNQEMLHMGLVANIINAVGGHPSFTHSKFIANYPSGLPGGIRPGLIVSLEKLSRSVARNVFMKIEEPDMNEDHKRLRNAIFGHLDQLRCEMQAGRRSNGSTKCKKHANETSSMNGTTKRGCPKFVNDYLKRLSEKSARDFQMNNVEDMDGEKELLDYKANIAAFYTHVLLVVARLTNCGANESIFTGKKELQLSTNRYQYGNGHMIEVTDYVSAVTAIKMIIEEGEGTSDCDPTVHYSDNNNEDLSHFTMFETITKGHRIKIQEGEKRDGNRERNHATLECDVDYDYSGKIVKYFPEGIWPIKKNIKHTDYKVGTLTEIQSNIFTVLYNRLLATLQKSFNGEKEYFTNALFLMYAVDYYGRQLVKFSIDPHGSPYVGPNAAPIFKWMSVDPKSVKSSRVNFAAWHKVHMKNGSGKKNKQKKKKESLKEKKRKQSRSKASNGQKGHRKFAHHKHLNGHNLKEAVESMARNKEEDRSKDRRRMQNEMLTYEREPEQWNRNIEEYERERSNDYRTFGYIDNNRDYNELIEHRRRFYNDVKDQMDMDRIIEDLWQSKQMEENYNNYDDDYDYDDDDNIDRYYSEV